MLQDSLGELYHRQDLTFLQPRAYIHYLLRAPLPQTPQAATLLDLFVQCLLQNIVEDVYPADLAQLGYSIHAEENGLSIKVSSLSLLPFPCSLLPDCSMFAPCLLPPPSSALCSLLSAPGVRPVREAACPAGGDS